MSDDREAMIRWGGLWEYETKAGEKYMAGNFGGIRLLVLRGRKKTDKSPDWDVLITEQRKREESRGNQRSEPRVEANTDEDVPC